MVSFCLPVSQPSGRVSHSFLLHPVLVRVQMQQLVLPAASAVILLALLAGHLSDAGFAEELDDFLSCDPDNPCKNNGDCLQHDFGYCCVCERGYSGFQCENAPSDSWPLWYLGGSKVCSGCIRLTDNFFFIKKGRRKRGIFGVPNICVVTDPATNETEPLMEVPENLREGLDGRKRREVPREVDEDSGDREKRGFPSNECLFFYEENCENFGKCFPGNARVSVQRGDSDVVMDKDMKELRVGDKVLTVDPHDLVMKYSEVYAFTHNAPHLMVPDYRRIETAGGAAAGHFTASPGHNLYKLGTSGEPTLVRAGDVTTGDRLLTRTSGGLIRDDVVTDTSTVTERGLYNPQTMNGNIIVNGVVSSCYTDAVPSRLAHNILWPMRQMHQMLPAGVTTQYQPVVDALVNVARDAAAAATMMMMKSN